MPEEKVVKAAQDVADRLQARGHREQAGALHAVLHRSHAGAALLMALREVCQTVLTAIEAADPSTATYVDELRLEVDKRLQEGHPAEGRA